MNTRGALLIRCDTASASEPEFLNRKTVCKLNYETGCEGNTITNTHNTRKHKGRTSASKRPTEKWHKPEESKSTVAQNQGQGSHDVDISSLYFLPGLPVHWQRSIGFILVSVQFYLFPDVPFPPCLLACVNSTLLCSYPVTSVIPAFVVCLPQLQWLPRRE